MGVNTIRRAEVAENGTSLTAANELAIRRALEAAGVEFIDENGGGPRRPPPQKPSEKALETPLRICPLNSSTRTAAARGSVSASASEPNKPNNNTAASCQLDSSLIAWKPMSEANNFFDTNVLLYLLSKDAAKADRAEVLLATGGVVSVQVLNEFASVATRKLAMTIPEIREILSTIRAVCVVRSLDIETHDLGSRNGRTIWIFNL
jgi:hypothetical protein